MLQVSHISYFSIFAICITISFSLSTSYCDVSDREYNCVLESRNDTIIFENSDNASVEYFTPTIKSLEYCQGSFHCKPNFVSTQSSEAINTDTYIVCFSEDSCLSNGGFEVASLRGFSDVCVKSSCMYLKDLTEFNITNAMLETDVYMCIKVGPEKLKALFCLKPACKSFNAIEKLCVCNYETQNCQCNSYCQNSLTDKTHKTYGLFLSFGDIYTTKGAKQSFLHWIILIVLCLGLTILLIIFCRLCKAAVDPSCGNEVQNPEVLRHILASNVESPLASTAVKGSFTTVERCSPPPSYEQVLKDKCIEFKKSVA